MYLLCPSATSWAVGRCRMARYLCRSAHRCVERGKPPYLRRGWKLAQSREQIAIRLRVRNAYETRLGFGVWSAHK